MLAVVTGVLTLITAGGPAADAYKQVADGVLSGLAITDRLEALETRRAELESELATTPAAPIVTLHPRMADHYRSVVASLGRALERSDSEAAAEARALVRKLIETWW